MNKIKALFKLVKQLFSILTKKQRKGGAFVLCVIIISSLLEMLSVSSLIPFFYSMLEPDKVLNSSLFKKIATILHFNGTSTKSLLVVMGIGLCVVFLFKGILLLCSHYFRLRFQNRIMKESALTMLTAYLNRDYQDMIDINSSEAVRDINVNTTSIYYLLQSTFLITTSLITTISVLFILCKINFSLTIELFGVVSIAGLIIISSIRKVITKSGIMFNEANLLVNKYAYEALNGLKEINVNNLNQSFIDRYENGVELKRKAELKFRFLQTCPSVLLEVVFIITLMIIVCIKLVSGENTTTMVPGLATIAYGALRMLSAISSMISEFNTIIYYKDSFNSAYNAIIAANNYTNKKQKQENENANKELLDFNSLEIKNLNWKYRSNPKNVLSNLNLKISKGESIGLIGPSGAGKSTLADIVLGILEPEESGVVFIDGVDLFTVRKSWAKSVGYIPQNVFLLDDTIKNNIIFGRDSESITDDQIWKALEQAQLKDFVLSLPKQLETIVGERGIKFSGGQRQRIAIARALFSNPKFLVLDEATSALDNETEKAVMDAIEYLQGKITLLIIAHRLSTISKCDKVYEIKNGTAIEVKK